MTSMILRSLNNCDCHSIIYRDPHYHNTTACQEYHSTARNHCLSTHWVDFKHNPEDFIRSFIAIIHHISPGFVLINLFYRHCRFLKKRQLSILADK